MILVICWKSDPFWSVPPSHFSNMTQFCQCSSQELMKISQCNPVHVSEGERMLRRLTFQTRKACSLPSSTDSNPGVVFKGLAYKYHTKQHWRKALNSKRPPLWGNCISWSQLCMFIFTSFFFFYRHQNKMVSNTSDLSQYQYHTVKLILQYNQEVKTEHCCCLIGLPWPFLFFLNYPLW